MTPTSTIIHGDCLDVLQAWPDNSIDAVVTDPPYGIGFMGKEWDTFKPGVAEARMVTNEERETSDNPNVRGRSRRPASSPSAVAYDRTLRGQVAFQDWCRQWATELIRVLKPGGHAAVFGAPRSYHRMACGLEDAGFEVRDSLMWVFGQGFPKSLNLEKGTGDLAWAGWGSALKPGYEPIVLARKPIEGTLIANVQKYGTGGLNIDVCRIAGAPWPAHVATGLASTKFFTEGDAPEIVKAPHEQGRWPANLLHDGSDEICSLFPAQAVAAAPVSGDEPSPASRGRVTGARARVPGIFHADSGSAARFFYQAKTSTGERHYGCESLPQATAGEMTGGRAEGSAGLKSPRAGAGRTGGGGNAHATVKPIRLMRWLCRLITPPGGMILDNFVGSGTTGIAADLEGFSFVGIEKDPAWVRLAETRIAAWMVRPDGEEITRP